MITNIRIFDYSHDVQFKVCAIIMLNATSLTQPPETTHTHTRTCTHTRTRTHARTRTRTRTRTRAHTHTQCAAYFIQRCLHANTTRAVCFPLHLFTDPHPTGPTPTHTQISPIRHEAAHKRTVQAIARVCMTMYAVQCVLFAPSCQTASRYDPADVSVIP